MSAYYTFSYPLKLSEDDKRGIQYLYGVRPQVQPSTPPPPPPPLNPETNEIISNVSEANAAFISNPFPSHCVASWQSVMHPSHEKNAIKTHYLFCYVQRLPFGISTLHAMACALVYVMSCPYPRGLCYFWLSSARMRIFWGVYAYTPGLFRFFRKQTNRFARFRWLILCSHYVIVKQAKAHPLADLSSHNYVSVPLHCGRSYYAFCQGYLLRLLGRLCSH